MKNIVILGAGVMGSALASVAAAANQVTLVGSPLDNHIIDKLKKAEPHPTLHVNLPETVSGISASELDRETIK